MFKRDAAVKPANAQPIVPAASTNQSTVPVQPAVPHWQNARDVVNIGKSVVIKGELNGSEDLTVEGRVEGMIDLREHVLTIGANGNIKAEVLAKSVIVLGTVTGNITASDKVEIRDGGSVDGDIISPRVAISEGARFRGSVDMQKKAAKPIQQSSASAQPKAAQQPPHSVGQQPDNPIAATAAAH